MSGFGRVGVGDAVGGGLRSLRHVLSRRDEGPVGRYDEGLADLDRALELDPGNHLPGSPGADVRGNGKARRGAGRPEPHGRVRSRTDWVVSTRGNVHAQMGSPPRGIGGPSITRSVSCRMTHKSWSAERKPHRAIGNYDQALADFDRAIELNPDGQRYESPARLPTGALVATRRQSPTTTGRLCWNRTTHGRCATVVRPTRRWAGTTMRSRTSPVRSNWPSGRLVVLHVGRSAAQARTVRGGPGRAAGMCGAGPTSR
jgi:tetratricopeptide (TPR) repeat protein